MCNTFRQAEAAAEARWVRRGEPARITPPRWAPGWDGGGATASLPAIFATNPSWSRFPLANARIESCDAKRTFAGATRSSRIVVPDVLGWAERMTAGRPHGGRGQNVPSAELCTGREQDPRHWLAGLALTADAGAPYDWAESDPTTRPPHFVVLTRAAPPKLATIHDRAPVRLTASEAATWLDGAPSEAMRMVRAAAAADAASDVTILRP